jgi:hypothetical protein
MLSQEARGPSAACPSSALNLPLVACTTAAPPQTSRLTQNVIDGFGVSGVEGVFRRVCEITLSVLRQHRGSILR